MINQQQHDVSRKHAPLYRKHAQLILDHIYAIDEADVGVVLLHEVVCGLVLIVSYRVKYYSYYAFIYI